jgi:hypothetical protein
MQKIIIIVLLTTFCSLAHAGKDTYQELCDALEASVTRSAKGDFRSAFSDLDALGQIPMGPKQVLANADSEKETFGKFYSLGALDEVERISLVFTGKSFFRFKLAEKREKGVVVWTFIGYKYRNQWYNKSMSITGNSDLSDLMSKAIDPADVQSAPKE